MPELPEVETIRRQIGPRLTGRRVLDAWAFDSAKFTPAFEVSGAELGEVRRRGKYLIIPLGDDRELVVHLGMTGSFAFAPADGPTDGPHLRAWWRLTANTHAPEETLLFTDIRRFGRLRVVDAGCYETIPTLATMGPEPFDPALDGEALWHALRKSGRRVKTQLLSQRPVAGVGNIYADEALWLARINPQVRTLSRRRATDLLDGLRVALSQGIANGGTTLRDYRDIDGAEGSNQNRLNAYGRRGLPCGRCTTVLRSADIDGRGTTWCPRCQRR
ncbi:MAG: bifunctional DNA-formamidopyrimidine glycosylase/DNA-(apurinic or apyrimidinic site) lyase [Actinomycetota bacterium]